METLTLADGTELRLHAWPATAGHRGQVLIVHGLGEHAGRYAHVAAALNAQGWQVNAYDQRGHGASTGARGALPGAEALCEDLAAVIGRVRSGPGPFVLLGHSMGGLLAARYVAEALAQKPALWSRPVDALVLSSPALEADLTTAQKLQLAMAGTLAPNMALGNGLKPEWVSRDPAVVRAYVADPLNHDRITPRLARFIVDGGVLVRARAPQWRVPTLLMWAGADRCVAPAGSAAFAADAPKAVVQHRCFDGLAHEIFNEPEQAEVLSHLTRWLEGLTSPTAPVAGPGGR